ncbi:MAG TPA: response regulator [Caulobacteraceae bacterium]|nr:response regulator [Caulobacteraceae bacterium]
MATQPQSATGLAYAARVRRGQLIQRMMMACLICLALNPLVGWDFTLAWVLAYGLAQVLECAAFAPVNTGRADHLPWWREALGCGAVLVNAIVFGSLSVPLWLLGGPIGGVCAALVLSAAILNTIVSTQGSRAMLAAAGGPQFAYLLATPLFMGYFGAAPHAQSAVALGCVSFTAYALILWNILDKNRAANLVAQAESERKRAEAEAATAAKSAFVATVSHDLRTPISAMLAGAAELQKTGGEASRSHAALISDAARMMKTLLDDILDHSKLQAGRMTVEESRFDLRALMAQTARLWGAETRKKGLRLRVEGAASVPQWVEGDPIRIRQILNNLISNALKFTDRGSITLRLSAWAAEDEHAAVRVQVADTGSGMTPEQLKRLFTPFDQTDAGVASRYGGTGLGLAISRDLARLMGGWLTAVSAKDRGSAFTLGLTLRLAEAPAAGSDQLAAPERVELPAPVFLAPVAFDPAPEHAPEPVVVEAPVEDDGERPLRVLVVDDHDINRRAVQLILQPLGVDITAASHGKMALEIAATEAFDVVFMDVRMPEMDGRETTRRLRAMDGPNRHVPVIAVTADNAEEDVAACLAAGMDHFVAKPIDAGRLLEALSLALEPQPEAETEDGRQVA